jgi:outer membrane protein TolC
VSQLNVAIETYIGTQKTYDTALELVNLSKEVRDTSKDQLVSGRSKIQEVLNAEVTLAENKIQLVNAEVELKLASYRIRALTHGLTKETGWKPFY